MRKERPEGPVPEHTMSTLLLIIPTVWLTTAALVVMMCRSAARADRAMYEQQRRRRDQRPVWPLEGAGIPCESRERRLWAGPLRVPDDRPRGGRCAAGS